MILRAKRHQVKKLSLKNNIHIDTTLLTNKDFFFYKITENIHWQKYPTIDKNEIVDISNNHYFGFRAMEKNASIILCDVLKIDNLVRLSKDAIKFNSNIMFYFDINEFSPKLKNNKQLITSYISEQIELVKKTSMDRIIIALNASDLSIEVLEVISYIYNYPLAIIGSLSEEQIKLITEKELVNINITL